MKTLHISLIMLAVIIILGFGLQPVHADDANSISVQNIQVQPSTVKVGDSFTITTTLVNNSTVPIVVEGGACVPFIEHGQFFTLMFDNHTKIKWKNLTCAGVGLSKILDPGKNITGTSPDSTIAYVATESGTANVTVTFSYHVTNQTDPTQPNIEHTISKSLLFTIYDNDTITKSLKLENHPVTNKISSPLKQFKSGIGLKNISCDDDLKLVVKKENNYPACVKPQSIHNLVAHGWASLLSPVTHLAYDASSSLGFDLSINPAIIKSGQAISIDISINNTHSESLIVPVANSWPISNYNLSLSTCSYYPMGIAILDGYYTEQNMSNTVPLYLYPGSGCTIGPLIENYTFQSLSSKATPECYGTEYSCPEFVVTKSHLSYSGYYDNNNQFHPFNGGTYTIVGGDEWGHLAIQHFVVANSTQKNPEKITGLENDTGIVTFRNQTYYFETPHYTQDTHVNPVQISFHNVVFTLFPSGFKEGLPTSHGCGSGTVGEIVVGSGSYYWTDAKFSDGTHELLNIFADSQPCPKLPEPTDFSTHTNPQAGLTFYDGKMKLLVSIDNQVSQKEKTNPFGIVGLMYYYGGGPCGVGVCPLNTFNLKMNSNYTAYLLGYNICNGNSCIVRNDLSILLPLNVIGTPNYTFIALPENPQWKYGDVFHIQVKVSSFPDNKTAVWADLGNSTITH